MKSVNKIIRDIKKAIPLITSFELTRIVVEVDRISESPNRDHRLELNDYSILYQSRSKEIFIVNKNTDEKIDYREFLNDNNMPNESIAKIGIEKKLFK